MIEIIALFIVCRTVGREARARGLKAIGYQITAVAIWFAAEVVGIVTWVILLGADSRGAYLPALVFALASVWLSLWIVRRRDAKPHDENGPALGFPVIQPPAPTAETSAPDTERT